ncbi:MAG: PAS-domain containing protein, partial [Pseudomonadota bacterium]
MSVPEYGTDTMDVAENRIEASVTGVAAAREMEQAHTLTTMLQGSSIGVAVYGSDLRLLACNAAFRTLRGLPDLPVGTSLRDVIIKTLDIHGVEGEGRETLADESIAQLLREKDRVFDIEDASGNVARIERR